MPEYKGKCFKLRLEDKTGEFARVLTILAETGATIQSAQLTYDEGGPVARFVVSEAHAAAERFKAFTKLGAQEVPSNRIQLSIPNSTEGLVSTVHALSRIGSACAFFYDRLEGDLAARVTADFFAAPNR